ncbi:MAG: D-3-phosphoglycerate dehydrogenase [Xanthobacteraceae bacterium]|nr:D-3-phosphoglycerate dehydrogenase [Xanthobacteraceae bacterium]
MPKILIEDDHFLKIVPVILDPATSDKHKRAVCNFFAHDEPDFMGWSQKLHARYPGLAPAQVVFAADQADLRAKITDADAVIVESLTVDDALLAAAPKLKLVQKFGTIATSIDTAACAKRGVQVATLRRHGNIAVAEQAFALLMALAKRIGPLNGVVTSDELEGAGWHVRPRSPHIGYSNFSGITGLKTLFGATLGIVGFGEVGRELAQRARAFEMKTVYFQRTRLTAGDEQALGATYAPLDDVMAQSDYLIVQLPLNAQTRGMINRDRLRRLKPGAMLINVARAELIDRDALIEALEAGRLGGFGLDVGYAEPADPADPLLAFRDRPDRNVILMPHTAIGARENALHDLDELCGNVWRAIKTS